MLTLLGAALIATALIAVYATIHAVRRPDPMPFIANLARGNVVALGATVVMALGVGALFEAAMAGNTLTALLLSLAALVLPFAGFFALLKLRPLPDPVDELKAANSQRPPAQPAVRQAA